MKTAQMGDLSTKGGKANLMLIQVEIRSNPTRACSLDNDKENEIKYLTPQEESAKAAKSRICLLNK